ncbi:MAG: hypothetical protein AAGA25_12465 [Planctomycetota bacterium]
MSKLIVKLMVFAGLLAIVVAVWSYTNTSGVSPARDVSVRIAAQSMESPSTLQFEPPLGGIDLDESAESDVRIGSRWIIQNATIS